MSAEPARHIERSITASKRDHANPAARKHTDKFQPDRPTADDDSGVAGAHFHFMNAAQHAGQWFDQRGTLVIDRVRHFQHIFGDDAPGYAHVLGIGAVVEQEIFAKIFLAAAAMVAAEARRGVCCDHANAHAPARVNPLADSHYFADNFVAKNSGRTDHFCVIAAFPYFQISAIGESETHTKQNFISRERRHIDFFDAQIFAPV